MRVLKRCLKCDKPIIIINDNGNTERTNDIYIDKWGYERYYCKDCMRTAEYWRHKKAYRYTQA